MNEKPNDDLTAIKGIGPVWQRRLRESLGVRTFQDLAALSSDEILSQLMAADQLAPTKSECDAWISQAQELVASDESSIKTESETEVTGEQTNKLTRPDKWKPFATYVVEYQGRIVKGEAEQRRTKVHHLEKDTDENWSGIVSVELCRWMLEQTDEITSPEVKLLLEADRARVQRELELELEAQQAAAQRELQQTLRKEQKHAQQALQQELDEERTQTRKQLEQEHRQAQKDLEQGLDEKRAQAELELERQLKEKRSQEQQVLEQELDGKRAQAGLELEQRLEDERAQAQQVLQQELNVKRAQAELELERQLENERAQAQQMLEQELDEKRTQIGLELERQLEDERAQTQQVLEQELDEKRAQARLELERQLEDERTQAKQVSEQESEEKEPQSSVEPETSEEEPQSSPESERDIPPTTQPSETQPVGDPSVALTISRLQAYQPAEAKEPAGIGLPGQPFSGFISSGKVFTFAVDIELAEPARPEIVEQGITYHAQFYAHNFSTGSKDQLGETKAATFVEGRSSYNAGLAGITLEIGIYELSAVLLTIQNGHPIVNHMMVVPLLQVV